MRDTADRFSGMTVGLHWFMAFAMISMMIFGYVIDAMPRGDAKSYWVWWHRGLGVAILAIAVWRIAWRIRNGLPSLPGRDIAWQENAAIAAHWFLLAATVFMPVSGLMRSLGRGQPVDVLGLFVIGPIEKNDTIREIGVFVHETGGMLVAAVIALHVAAALKHHLMDKDATLRRMLGADVSRDVAGARATRR